MLSSLFKSKQQVKIAVKEKKVSGKEKISPQQQLKQLHQKMSAHLAGHMIRPGIEDELKAAHFFEWSEKQPGIQLLDLETKEEGSDPTTYQMNTLFSHLYSIDRAERHAFCAQILFMLYDYGAIWINSGAAYQSKSAFAKELAENRLNLLNKYRAIPDTLGRKSTKNHLRLFYIMRVALDHIDRDDIYEMLVKGVMQDSVHSITMGTNPIYFPQTEACSLTTDFAAFVLVAHYVLESDRFTEKQKNDPTIKLLTEYYLFGWGDITQPRSFTTAFFLDRQPTLADFRPNFIILHPSERELTAYWVRYGQIVGEPLDLQSEAAKKYLDYRPALLVNYYML